MFNKMMFGKKKPEDKMSENEMKAKTSVLQDLRSQASAAMGDKLKGLKKVTVAAPDKQGLAMGLDKAKEMTEGSPEEEMGETPEMEASEEDMGMEHDVSLTPEEEALEPDEIDKKIQELEALKAKKLHQ